MQEISLADWMTAIRKILGRRTNPLLGYVNSLVFSRMPRFRSWPVEMRGAVADKQRELLNSDEFCEQWIWFATKAINRHWAPGTMFNYLACRAGEAAVNAYLDDHRSC
jgi:hypothetical protein